MADATLGAAQWVVAKALAPIADGVLEAWAASRNFGLNIEALSRELLLVKATLEQAARKDICGTAMEELLQRLRDSAHNAEDLLDELDYFRIHDALHGTHDAADVHGKGALQDLALSARHTAKALGKQLASLPAYCFGANAGDHRQGYARQHVRCCAWQRGRQGSRGDSSSSTNANQADQEVSGCMPKLGKLFPSSSSRHPHVSADEDRGNAQETSMPEFNRTEFSQRVKGIVEKLQPGNPRFFADWDPNHGRALEDAEGGEEQQTQLVSSTLQELETDGIAGLLAAPVCSFLSSSLTKLELCGYGSDGMERFSKEQEDALQLLSSLQELVFWSFKDLQQLPAGLRNITSLKILSVCGCPAVSSLPNDGLPESLQELYVASSSKELKQYCRGLEGTIPKIDIRH